MYTAFSYWFARLLGDVPTIIAEITVYSIIAYFAAGLTLVSNGTHFALFLSMLLAVRVMGLMWNETVTGRASNHHSLGFWVGIARLNARAVAD